MSTYSWIPHLHVWKQVLHVRCMWFVHHCTREHCHIMNHSKPKSLCCRESISLVTMYNCQSSKCTIPPPIHSVLGAIKMNEVGMRGINVAWNSKTDFFSIQVALLKTKVIARTLRLRSCMERSFLSSLGVYSPSEKFSSDVNPQYKKSEKQLAFCKWWTTCNRKFSLMNIIMDSKALQLVFQIADIWFFFFASSFIRIFIIRITRFLLFDFRRSSIIIVITTIGFIFGLPLGSLPHRSYLARGFGCWELFGMGMGSTVSNLKFALGLYEKCKFLNSNSHFSRNQSIGSPLSSCMWSTVGVNHNCQAVSGVLGQEVWNRCDTIVILCRAENSTCRHVPPEDNAVIICASHFWHIIKCFLDITGNGRKHRRFSIPSTSCEDPHVRGQIVPHYLPSTLVHLLAAQWTTVNVFWLS